MVKIIRKMLILFKVGLFGSIPIGWFIFRVMAALVILYILQKDFGQVGWLWGLYGAMWVCYPVVESTIKRKMEKLTEQWNKGVENNGTKNS